MTGYQGKICKECRTSIKHRGEFCSSKCRYEYNKKYNKHICDLCRVAVSSQDRYVPAIFYQNTSEFGNNVTHSAGEDSPYFPVDYLVVSVNGPTFPQQSDPLFTNMFPIENRVMSAQNESAIRSHLGSSSNKPFRPTGQLKVCNLLPCKYFCV